MDQKNKKPSRNLSVLPLFTYQVLVFLVQIFILIICIEYTQIIYNNDILPDKEVKENFLQTACTVVSKKLSEKTRLVHGYRADFLISYTVNNIPYQRWVTGNGLNQSFFHEQELQEQTLNQFELGSSYTCWYKPEAPQIAVLVLRHNWVSTLPLIIPTFIGLVAIYYILKNLLQFMGAVFQSLQGKTRFKK